MVSMISATRCHLCAARATCLERRREARKKGQNRKHPAPGGDISLADERVKADRETQRRERGQARQRALQHASVPAKASMRAHGTESESTIVRKRPAQSEDENTFSI